MEDDVEGSIFQGETLKQYGSTYKTLAIALR